MISYVKSIIIGLSLIFIGSIVFVIGGGIIYKNYGGLDLSKGETKALEITEEFKDINLDLITYSGETNLIVSSGAMQPKITLKVLSNISNVVKLLQEKVSVLENKLIKGLKQVLAGDMMSLAHLLYPEDFEKDNEVATLEEL